MTQKDKKGVVILAGVFVCFALLFVAGFCLSSANSFDSETLCRNGKTDPVLKLLIDKTDPWDELSRQRLAAFIRSLKSVIKRHERLSVYILDETGTYSPSPVFDMCNPGTGEQGNVLWENQRLMQEKFKEQFAAPLDEALETLLRPGTARRSLIIETMHGLRGSGEERLMIVSDMMQNSDRLSFYGSYQAFNYDKQDDICAMSNPYSSVKVLYVNRPAVSVSRKQQARNFWDKCLDRVGNESEWRVL